MDKSSLVLTVAYLISAVHCTWYFPLKAPTCPLLSPPAKGYVSTSGLTHGSAAKYSCQYGYFVFPLSSSVRVCQNGEWTGRPPTCEPLRVLNRIWVKCPKPQAPRNGYVLVSKRSPGGLAKYKCLPGFTLRPASSQFRRCKSNGRWNGVNPICSAAQPAEKCGDPSIPLNGACKLKGTNKGSVAECYCHKDFELLGNRFHTCQRNGKWSGSSPVCKLRSISCEWLKNPQNGLVKLISTTAGPIAVYSCNPPYGLHGNSLRICQANGQWTENEPLCIKENSNCNLIPDPNNGNVELSGTNEGSTAVYSCNQGFILEGNAQRLCQRNSTWSGKEPICQRTVISCKELLNPRNGFVSFTDSVLEGSLATYSCKKGYILRGRNSCVCKSDGNWSESPPICQKLVIDCGMLENPNNGIVVYRKTGFGAIALYRCHRGFHLIGQNKRVCKKNSAWSGKTPICRAVMISLRKAFCPRLSPPENGYVKVDKLRIGSIARYRCSKDYHIVGGKVRRCLKRGIWSGVEPRCIFKDSMTDFEDMK